jgi:hypothetical protein
MDCFQLFWTPDIIIHDLVSFNKPEILNQVCLYLKSRNLEFDTINHRVDRQNTKLFFQSFELGLSHPHTRRRVCPLPFGSGRGGGVHTLLRERGWGSPNSDERTDTWYSRYICTLCYKPITPSGVGVSNIILNVHSVQYCSCISKQS